MPTEQLNSALEAISALPNTELKSVSGFYQSKPLGPQDQPDYVNAVAMIETTRPPLALLDELQRIENEQGRVRLRRWGERTLDLDILLYGDQIIQNERLTVPSLRYEKPRICGLCRLMISHKIWFYRKVKKSQIW